MYPQDTRWMARALVAVVALLLLSTTAHANDAAIWQELIPQADRERQIAAIKGSRNSIAHTMGLKARQLKFSETVSGWNGKSIRIPGYAVPLEFDGEKVIEFLLVPYFGACIHVPPPPANQIIHVRYEPGIDGFDYEKPYWVEGTLATGAEHADAGFDIGYRIAAADAVTPYAFHSR